jgi:5'-deoxynucleotidase YfbR-like HD superfamily hydrolase
MKLQPRIEELKKVYRYVWSPCDPMFYRPNLHIHSNRVEWISREIMKYLDRYRDKAKVVIDTDLVVELARFHDDTEIITWDILAMDKESFSEESQNKHDNHSKRAIDILYENYWNISDKYNYADLLKLNEDKQWLEFKIVDFSDKLDANLEIAHELLAWNSAFAIKLEKWGIDLHPFAYTRNKLFKILPEVLANYDMDLNLENTFLDLSWDYDSDYFLNKSKNHDLENLRTKSWYNSYDLWIELHFRPENKEFLNYLTNKTN